MPRPIDALIHPDALAHNLARARAHAPDARVWAVVKADAYGHGIERAFAGLRGADGLALLDLAEAERLRALDWRGPILLLEGVFEPRDLELCSRLNLWHAVHCDQQIDWLARHKTHAPHRVFLKMNSGMNRLGFTPAAFRQAWTRLNALPQVDEISLMTHFSDADGPRGIAHQVAAFQAATHDLPGERSISNSAAVLRHMGPGGVAMGIIGDTTGTETVLGIAEGHPDSPTAITQRADLVHIGLDKAARYTAEGAGNASSAGGSAGSGAGASARSSGGVLPVCGLRSAKSGGRAVRFIEGRSLKGSGGGTSFGGGMRMGVP